MTDRTNDGTWLWVGLLTTTTALGTLALACAAPFAALAAVAATRMPMRAGLTLLTLTWAINQVIGFGVLGYPTDPTTIAWGFGILTAAWASMAGARWGDRAVAASGAVVRLATAFGTGFVAYKLALLAWSTVLGGVHTALSPYWTARQFALEAAILVGLVGAYHALVAIGVPAARRARIA